MQRITLRFGSNLWDLGAEPWRPLRQSVLELVPAFVNFLNCMRHIIHRLRRSKQHPMLNPNRLPASLLCVGARLRAAGEVDVRCARAERRAIGMKLVLD